MPDITFTLSSTYNTAKSTSSMCFIPCSQIEACSSSVPNIDFSKLLFNILPM